MPDSPNMHCSKCKKNLPHPIYWENQSALCKRCARSMIAADFSDDEEDGDDESSYYPPSQDMYDLFDQDEQIDNRVIFMTKFEKLQEKSYVVIKEDKSQYMCMVAEKDRASETVYVRPVAYRPDTSSPWSRFLDRSLDMRVLQPEIPTEFYLPDEYKEVLDFLKQLNAGVNRDMPLLLETDAYKIPCRLADPSLTANTLVSLFQSVPEMYTYSDPQPTQNVPLYQLYLDFRPAEERRTGLAQGEITVYLSADEYVLGSNPAILAPERYSFEGKYIKDEQNGAFLQTKTEVASSMNELDVAQFAWETDAIKLWGYKLGDVFHLVHGHIPVQGAGVRIEWHKVEGTGRGEPDLFWYNNRARKLVGSLKITNGFLAFTYNGEPKQMYWVPAGSSDPKLVQFTWIDIPPPNRGNAFVRLDNKLGQITARPLGLNTQTEELDKKNDHCPEEKVDVCKERKGTVSTLELSGLVAVEWFGSDIGDPGAPGVMFEETPKRQCVSVCALTFPGPHDSSIVFMKQGLDNKRERKVKSNLGMWNKTLSEMQAKRKDRSFQPTEQDVARLRTLEQNATTVRDLELTSFYGGVPDEIQTEVDTLLQGIRALLAAFNRMGVKRASSMDTDQGEVGERQPKRVGSSILALRH